MNRINNSSIISITGATGFIRAHLVRHFAVLGYSIEAIGRQAVPSTLLQKYASYTQADISKKVPPLKGEIVIHTAALASDTAAWNSLVDTNVEGTKRVYKAAQKCRLFIYISSASVYPFQKQALMENAVNESIISSDYGKSKYLAEQFLKQQKNEKKIIILRPRAVYGRQDRVLLPRILNLVRAKRIIAPGDLDIQVSMTHIDNLIIAIEACIQQSWTENFGVWNITDDRIYTLRAVVTALLNGIYKEELPYWALPVAPLRILAKRLQAMGWTNNFTPQSLDYVTQSTVLNIDKIKADTTYQASTDFYQALPHLLEWIEKVGVERVKSGDKNLPWLL